MAIAGLVLGVVLFVVGVQGGIRLFVDSADPGLLSWVPGGSTGQLAAYVVLAVAGAVLAGWSRDRARKQGHDV